MKNSLRNAITGILYIRFCVKSVLRYCQGARFTAQMYYVDCQKGH